MPIKFKSRRVMGEQRGLHGRLTGYPIPRHLRGRIPKNDIWIRDDVHDRRGVIRHERVEVHLMKNRHMGYKKAHKIANKYG